MVEKAVEKAETAPNDELVWDTENPLHAEMPTPSNTLSMVTDATQEAEAKGYRADEVVRLLYCQSYLIDSEEAFDDAQKAFQGFITGVDSSKYSGEVVAFYIFQQKTLENPGTSTLKYICLHTLLLSGLVWEGAAQERPQSFVVHQSRRISAPHQTVSNAPAYETSRVEQAAVEVDIGHLSLLD